MMFWFCRIYVFFFFLEYEVLGEEMCFIEIVVLGTGWVGNFSGFF